jgi:undecaprenyl-diphosphatase
MSFLQTLDNAVLSWWQSHHTPFWDVFMVEMTAVGGHVVLPLVVLFTVGFLLVLRRYQTACFVLGAVISGSVLTEIVKVLVGRDRPTLDVSPGLVSVPHTSSFPSGHSMLSAVVYLTLALLVAGRLQSQRIRVYLISWSLLVTFLVGLSRMYLGVHYLTDVVAGWTVGLVWAVAWRWIEGHTVRFRERALDAGNNHLVHATTTEEEHRPPMP